MLGKSLCIQLQSVGGGHWDCECLSWLEESRWSGKGRIHPAELPELCVCVCMCVCARAVENTI